jgi:hypothetical protein
MAGIAVVEPLCLLISVKKYVEMATFSTLYLVMMATLYQGMAVVVLVLWKLDGLVAMAPIIFQIFAQYHLQLLVVTH